MKPTNVQSQRKLMVLFVCFAFIGQGFWADARASSSGQDTSASEPAPPLEAAENNYVAIPKAAFGKDYLLLTSVIPQVRAATSRALASRIVVFELFHDGVDLYESTRGLVVTQDLPARRLLTTFPIIKRQDDKVVVDFGRGMDRILTNSWYTIRRGFRPDALIRSLEMPRSRVFVAEASPGRLMIRQSAQGRVEGSGPPTEPRFELRYFLKPYVPDDYKIKEQTAIDHRYVRFFETHAHLEEASGRSTTPILRFHPDRPIKFYYSANTPDDYVQAVKDGVLYWNRAFGKNIVTVERAPEGVTAPAPDHNVIQWVPWDNAGFAYADAIPDPYTGQTLHGQAYMTSVFAIGNIQRARRILRIFKSMAEKDGDEKKDSLSFPLDGIFAPSPCSCQVDSAAFARDMAEGIGKLITLTKGDDRRILRASQDVVRHVTAHEVGHVLGLRHNFGASLATNVSHNELDAWLRTYLTSDEPPDTKGKIVTNSSMEYSTFASRVFAGHQIGRTEDVLPHDRAAIRWGYYGDSSARDEKMLFATDGDVSTWGDVTRFDYGSDPVIGSFAEVADQLRTLPNTILERYIAAKAPRDPRDRQPLASVALNVTPYVRGVSRSYESMLQWFGADVRSLRVERDFDYVGELNREARVKAHWHYLQDQVKRLGGVDRMGFSFLPVELKLTLKDKPEGVPVPERIDAAKMTQRLKELLASEAYREFVGLDGETYSFTEDEQKLITEQAKAFFKRFETELVKAILTVLGKAKRDLGFEATKNVGDDDIVAGLERRIVDLAEKVILKTDESKRLKGKLNKAHVEVIDYAYDHETRLAAARMLGDQIGSFPQWSTDAKARLHKTLKSNVDGALNIDKLKEFKPEQLSRSLRQWYLRQQEILKLLPPKK